ncbi:TPA: hypothetical protein N0F65_006198 [Lagenidium giganteum]|uniref:L-dopachrome isomerase n=1 Tax=Lagenidium giganteum TaxID=4803 RepID=A0AAV2Z4N3_9STRA|nr:TPA: hypothetical protein N0F65_006198 [Lagenidium giganteum]
MPFVHVSTNVARSSINVAAALRGLSKCVSTALARPEEVLMVKLDLDSDMMMDAVTTPCAMVQIRGIGHIDAEWNPNTVRQTTDTVGKLLGINSERIFINLDSIEGGNWGYKGESLSPRTATMPYCTVSSNARAADIDANDALQKVSQAVSKALGKPETYVMVQLNLDTPMLFQGTTKPCAMILIRSIGKIDATTNAATAATLTDAVSRALNVPVHNKMPFVHVSSNVARAKVDVDAALCAISESVSTALDRPEAYVMVKLELDNDMMIDRLSTPCAMVHIRSIGKIDSQRNPKTVEQVTATVSKVLGVEATRIFVNLDDIDAGNWGHNGNTVA